MTSTTSSSEENRNVVRDRKSTPLRILATFYFQPSTWFFARNNKKFRKLHKDLLIYQDDDYDNKASVCYC